MPRNIVTAVYKFIQHVLKYRWTIVGLFCMAGIGYYVGSVVHTMEQTSHTDATPLLAPHIAQMKAQQGHDDTAPNPVGNPAEDFTRNCTSHFGATLEEDLAKIDSYKFEGIDNYIKELFPSPRAEPEIPEVPVFVTAFSSNHFAEGQVLLESLDNTVRRHFKGVKVIVYDLGLKKPQVETLNTKFFLEVRRFPFDQYPKHVRSLKTYTWKPIIIQTVAKEHPFLFWVDASIRFKTGELGDLFKQVKEQGLVNRHGGMKQTGSISERTHQATFQFLQEDPCLYGEQMEKAGGFIFLLANQFITKYFLRPWVSCALAPGCMDPIPGSGRLIMCPANKTPHKYHLCHRFDQSVLGILFTRLFHRNLTEHALDLKYLMVCGGTKIGPKYCYHYED